MKRLIRTLLDRLSYVKKLHEQVKKQGEFPAGHFYSPIPNHADVLDYINSTKPQKNKLLDINLNQKSQSDLLQEYHQFYHELPFPEKKSADCRYYYDQTWFCYADAIYLYSFLRKNKPKRIVEIGSGFSSAVILDTVERFLPAHTKVTFIEPQPDRLLSLLKDGDQDKYQLIKTKVQQAPVDLFAALKPGDLLFIDSSHIVKCGSDVQTLMFDILPILPSGIFVHFHDVFYPFEYPSGWLAQGRYWNEDYFLRAFLAYNSQWSIYFFSTYVATAFENFLKEKMPLCLKDPGGSLYIQKNGKD